jgi:type I restriction enzyme S subunit
LTAIIGGGTPSRDNPSLWGGPIPWLTVKDMRGRRPSQAQEYITEKAVNESATNIIPPDTVITATRVGLGKVVRVPFAAAINQDLKGLVVGPDLDKSYLEYWLVSIASFLESIGSGTTVKGIRLETLRQLPIPLAPLEEQREIVAEIEKQFSRLDEAVANLQRVKANLKRYERATIASLTNPESFDSCLVGTIADVAISLDNLRKPVNKLERAKRPGNIPYLGANGQTGWIDVPLFDEELVLVVEDETFVGRTEPFCYYFADPCWVNNHTHVLRARPEVVSAKYLNLALSYYPFIPLTTGSTGRRKLTKAALMTAPITVPSLTEQTKIVNEVERCMSISREIEIQVELNLKSAMVLRQATLSKAFGSSQ